MPRRISIFVAIVSLALLPTLSAVGDGNPAPLATYSYTLSFRDSDTGWRILPSHVFFDGVDFAQNVTDAGSLVVDATLGEHNATIDADGYKSLETTLTAMPDGATEYVITLDPVQRPYEFQEQTVTKSIGQNSNVVLVGGFVVDAINGMPINGATVSILGSDLSAQTNERGAYQIIINASPGSPFPVSKIAGSHVEATLQITAAGFSDQYYEHLVLPSGSTQFRNFRLFADAPEIQPTETAPRIVSDQLSSPTCSSCDKSGLDVTPKALPSKSLQALPSSIRVGRGPSSSTLLNCTGYYQACTKATNNCGGPVDVVSLDTYVKRVMRAELGVSQMINEPYEEQFKANAIAIRSYGAYFTYNSAGSAYDICNSTSCQCYDASIVVGPMMADAVDATSGMYYTTSSGGIALTEYSAWGDSHEYCGNWYLIHYDINACVEDDVLYSHAANYPGDQIASSHGRGLSQWGSYWRAQRGDTYQQILNFYYGDYGFVLTGAGNTGVPTVQTLNASNLSATSATLNGSITNDGGQAITDARFEWTSNFFPGTVIYSVPVVGNSFSYTLNGLAPNTTYTYHCYAKNNSAWNTSTNDVSFTTNAFVSSQPDMAVTYQSRTGAEIVPGDFTPSTADGTDFSNIPVSDYSPARRTFVIQNYGNATLQLTGSPIVSISGSSDFSIYQQPTLTSVAPAGATGVTVSFYPQTPGLKQATISISSNDASHSPYQFTLGGVGVLRTLSVVSNGASGVPITVSPADAYGQSNGTTDFTRGYANATSVTLTAPISSGGMQFVNWTGDLNSVNGQTATVNTTGDYTAIAVYTAITGSLGVSQPTAGASWSVGAAHDITWTSSGIGSNIKIQLWKGSGRVAYLTGVITNLGSYSWTPSNTLAQGSDYFVFVYTPDYSYTAYSDYFTITNPLYFIAPVSGQQVAPAQVFNVQWGSNLGTVGNTVKLRLYKGSSAVMFLTGNISNSGSYSWIVPSTLAQGSDYELLVYKPDYSVQSYSSPFTVTSPALQVIAPSTGTSWKKGTTQIVTWNTTVGLVGSQVKLRLYNGTTPVIFLSGILPNNGSFSWSIPSSLVAGSNYRLLLYKPDYTYQTYSNTFAITN